jgi:Tfp pilus assembly protein PilF
MSAYAQTQVQRIGLMSTAMVLVALGFDMHIWNPQVQPGSLAPVLLSFAATLLGLALIVISLLQDVDARWIYLIPAAVLLVLCVRLYQFDVNDVPGLSNNTDSEMITDYSIQVLKMQMNPYSWDYSDIYRVFRDNKRLATPYLDGTLQHRVAYPGLPTLLLFVTDMLGIGGASTLSLLSHTLIVLLLFFSAPVSLRPVVLLPLLLMRDFGSFTLAGIQDVTWAMLLLCAVIAWRRPILRAVFVGLAASFRQQPWLLVPFLLIAIWQEEGSPAERLPRVIDFIAISGGVFLVVNLPFIVWDLGSWVQGTFEHLYSSFNFYSHGISVITRLGYLDLPRWYYSLVQYSLLLVLLVLQWRHPRLVGRAFWFFPAIVGWFYYRFLLNYWIYWIPALIAAIARYTPRDDVQATAHKWRFSAILAGSVAAILLGVGIFLAARSPTLEVALAEPLEHTEEESPIEQISVTVTNVGEHELSPRFSVQHDPDVGAQPWIIHSGQETLNPGETGEYQIATQGALFRAIPLEGAQLVVTDSKSDTTFRELLEIVPDRSASDPDAIRNPSFQTWSPTESITPNHWTLDLPLNSSSELQLDNIDGRSALVMTYHSPAASSLSILRLTQKIVFPERFALWVYPTWHGTDPTEHIYGLELLSDDHRLWVLFGDSNGQGFLAPNHAYIYLPTPLDQWSEQVIDVRELYRSLDWALPDLSLRSANGLEYAAHQLDLSLIVGARTGTVTRAIFGELVQDEQPSIAASAIQLSQVLEQPTGYYVHLGDTYLQERNHDLAEAAYLTALAYDDTSANASFGLAESLFWQNDGDGAIEAYQQALDLGYPKPFMVYKGLGWVYSSLGALEDARLNFELAIQTIVDPEQNANHLADALVGLGWATLSLDGCEEAMPFFERAEDLVPGLSAAVQGFEACSQAP